MKKTMKMFMLIAVMLIVTLTLTGCGNTNENDNLEGLAVYTMDEDMTGYTKCTDVEGIEFYYPSNYTVKKQSGQTAYMDPEILGANVNVASDNFPSSYSFENYVDASIVGIKAQMQISGDINKEYINLNGRKAVKLEYVATQSGYTMKCTQVLVVKDKKAYALTVVSLEKDAEALQPKLDKMIKSFK